MSFMQKEIYYGEYYEVSANHGETWIIPLSAVGQVRFNRQLHDYVEGRVDDPDEKVEIKFGWLGRLSAPGYMDCTEWSVYDTEDQASVSLTEMYGEDED